VGASCLKGITAKSAGFFPLPSTRRSKMTLDHDGDGSAESVSTKTIHTRVDAVHFEGLDRTKRDILGELVKPIFSSKDIGEVIQQTQTVRARFHELGLFRNVQVSIEESSKPAVQSSDLSNLSITFDVEETRRYAGGIFTSASNNEASLILELRSPNLLGRGLCDTHTFSHQIHVWFVFS